MKGDYPGQDKEAKKAGEEAYEAVRARAQSLVSAYETIQFHRIHYTMVAALIR